MTLYQPHILGLTNQEWPLPFWDPLLSLLSKLHAQDIVYRAGKIHICWILHIIDVHIVSIILYPNVVYSLLWSLNILECHSKNNELIQKIVEHIVHQTHNVRN